MWHLTLGFSTQSLSGMEILLTPTQIFQHSELKIHTNKNQDCISVSVSSLKLIQDSMVPWEKENTPCFSNLWQQVISPLRATCSDASDPSAAHIKSPIDWPDRLGHRDQEVLNCSALNRADFWTKRCHLLELWLISYCTCPHCWYCWNSSQSGPRTRLHNPLTLEGR